LKELFRVSLLSALVAGLPVLATEQEKDQVRFGDGDLLLLEVPLNDYLRRLPVLPRFDPDTTANWKAYRAEWAIRDARLYLTAFWAVTNRTPASETMLFPGRKVPILADWYSGKLHIVEGMFWEGGDWTYKRVTALGVTNGVIATTNVMKDMRRHFDGKEFVLRPVLREKSYPGFRRKF
jgi:hypothetical protein